jgi:MinD-like ATPase involved in chromosome partitioning or flagellar assembly
VLMVDWDLEAPGLHRFFHPFLLDKELASTDGVIDFVTDYVVEAISLDAKSPKDWYRPLADISRYAVAIDYGKFPTPGRLDLVPAGRQGTGYASRVNGFDWTDFYSRLGGAAFLDAVRESMRTQYDYVLIDSRTGVSDTAGICTVHMPDAMALCFTLNRQSIEGAAAVATSVRAQRPETDFDLFPIPTRVEFAEKTKLDRARDYARRRFDPFLSSLPSRARDEYWGDVEVIYQPFYAYEEILAPFADRPGQKASLLAAVERITDRITVEQLDWEPVPEAERERIRALYELEPTREQAAEIARLREKISATEQAASASAQVASRKTRTAILVATITSVAAAGIGLVYAFNVLGGSPSSTTPDATVSKSAIIGVITQQAQFFTARKWQKLYNLFSSTFQSRCPYATFKTNYSAFWTATSGKATFQSTNVAVNGTKASATYRLALGEAAGARIVTVTSRAPDKFVFERGRWLNEIDSISTCNPATSPVGAATS